MNTEAVQPAPLGRRIHLALVVLLLIALAVQFYLAGRGAFGASTYSTHKDVGGTLHLASLLFLILTAAMSATRTRVDIGLAALLFVLLTVQAAIGTLKHPEVGAFHPVNALLIVGLAFALLKRDRELLAG